MGDRVRIDIPDITDPDHEYHAKHGEIVEIIDDYASDVSGDPDDDRLVTIELEDSGEEVSFRPTVV